MAGAPLRARRGGGVLLVQPMDDSDEASELKPRALSSGPCMRSSRARHHRFGWRGARPNPPRGGGVRGYRGAARQQYDRVGCLGRAGRRRIGRGRGQEAWRPSKRSRPSLLTQGGGGYLSLRAEGVISHSGRRGVSLTQGGEGYLSLREEGVISHSGRRGLWGGVPAEQVVEGLLELLPRQRSHVHDHLARLSLSPSHSPSLFLSLAPAPPLLSPCFSPSC